MDPYMTEFVVRRTRRWAPSLTALSMLAGVATASLAFENAPGSIGLQGIYSAEVPPELSADAFEGLDGNWEKWSQETVDAIAKVYEQLASDSLEAQKEGVATLKSKLGVVERALSDRRYASIDQPLTELRGALSRRIDLAEAVLATLEGFGPDAQTKRMDDRKQRLATAISKLEQDLGAIKGGKAWLPFAKIDALKSALEKGEGLDEAIKAAQAQIAKRTTIEDAAQKAFLNRPTFVRVDEAGTAYLEAAGTPVDEQALRQALKNVVGAAEQFQVDRSSETAAALRSAFTQARGLAPDGAKPLAAALQKHFFNYNLRISATEAFLGRLLNDARVESGGVRDYVLGANVGGSQTTSTQVSVNLKPANKQIKFDLLLNGVVNSSTAGATDQATIYTSGYHTFYATKEISFDGDQFTTAPGLISVNANNTTTGAATRFSGGLFGGIAERIALSEAAKREGAAEAIAASRVRDRVLPQFDAEANRNFADTNRNLSTGLLSGLKAKGLFPDARSLSSTDTDLRMSTRLMADTELGGGDPKYVFTPAGTAAVMIHESLLNNSLNRMGIAGETLTEDQLREKIEQFLSEAFARKVELAKPEAAAQTEAADGEEAEAKGPTTFIFAKQDPISVRVENGAVTVKLKAGFRREGREDIPEVEVFIPLEFALKGNTIEVSQPENASVDGPASPTTKKEISRRVSRGVPTKPLSAVVELKATRRPVKTVITQLKMADGWIALSIK